MLKSTQLEDVQKIIRKEFREKLFDLNHQMLKRLDNRLKLIKNPIYEFYEELQQMMDEKIKSEFFTRSPPPLVKSGIVSNSGVSEKGAQ